MKIVKPSVSLEWHTMNPEIIIERAGRTCYKSEDKITSDSAAKFIKMLGEKGHASVIEHAVASFRIICDRGVSHEIVRHRIASIDDEHEDANHPSPSSFSQESTRYCNYSKDKFGGIKLSPMLQNLTNKQIERRTKLYETMEAVYLAEISEGVSPQQARDNLPICLKTELVMTCNFREWKHFLKLRTSSAAHPQMREIALMIQAELRRIAPTVFEAKDEDTGG